MRVNVAVVFMGVLLAVVPASASSVDELDISGGTLFVGSVPPAGHGQGNSYLPTFGVSLPIRIAGPLYLEPMIDFYGLYYEWVAPDAVAVPTQYETAAGFFTMASIVSLQAMLRFPIASTISIGASAGADFLLRLPVDPENTDPASVEGRALAQAWFFDAGRFFYPEARLLFAWQATDTVGLRFNLRALFPLFHAWDGSGAPFADQLLVSAGVQIGVRLGSPTKAR